VKIIILPHLNVRHIKDFEYKMYVKFKILFAVLLFPSILFSQTVKETWTYHNPKPQEKGLFAVFVADSLTIFAAGEEGTIIRTKDKGINWDVLSSGTSQKINSLYFIDTNTGYALGDSGIILNTYNGGDSWNKSQNTKIGNIRSCWFINENKGFICDSNGKLYLTEDGGVTWILKYHERPEYFNKLFFIDDTTGWAAGTIIIKTTDGGMNWGKIETGFNVEFNDIYFLNGNEGWAGGEKGAIIHTADCGNNWKLMDYATESTLYGVYFYNKEKGCVATEEELAYTINGGEEWKINAKMNKGRKSMHFCDGYGFVVNEIGEIFQSSVYKKYISWNSYSGKNVYEYLAVDFVDENHGWIVGNANCLLKTTNGGNTWKEIQINFSSSEPIGDVEFKDLNNGWILDTHRKKILHATDGGESWETQVVDPATNWSFSKIFIKDNGEIWITGQGLNKSTDDGKTWKNYDIDGLWFTDILFTNNTLGFAAALYSTYHTADGGDTWEIIPDIGGSNIDGIQFVDDSTGWVMINNGKTLFYTKDGGKTWGSTKDLPYKIGSLCFIDRNEGWYSYGMDNIYNTSDGGRTWEHKMPDFWFLKYSTISPWKLDDYFNLIFWDIEFVTKDHGWFVGNSGIILEYKREVITEPDTNNNENHLIPESFNLTQNYPNPFNTETTIKYDVKENARTKIKIYNLQGQEIKTLLNEYKYAGSYYVTWNGRDNAGTVVSSGIYICTMKTSKYVKSIKLVFLK